MLEVYVTIYNKRHLILKYFVIFNNYLYIIDREISKSQKKIKNKKKMKKMLTMLTWFGILLTVIRKDRMIKNVSNKFI